MTWGRYIIDTVFRGGDNHSNNGEKIIHHVMCMIRTRYSETVPIIIRMDSGFFDQDIFAEMEKLDLGFICSGKFYGDIKTMIESLPETAYDHHFTKTEEDVWHCFEFGDRRKSWGQFRRAIFWRPLLEEKQFLLPGTHLNTLGACPRTGTLNLQNLPA